MMEVIEARGLPEAPLDAASVFAADHLPQLRGHDAGDLMIVFDPAGHTHESWRKAVIAELAREAAPARVNAVVGADPKSIGQVLDFLERAPGVTGQVFTTNDAGIHSG